jgi:hypothetical protein
MDRDNRQLVVSMLPADLATAIPRLGAARPDLISIVRTCRQYPGGLEALVEAVTMIEPGSLGQSDLKEWAERRLRGNEGR